LNENKKRKLKKKIDKIKKKMEGENVSSDSNEDEEDDEDKLQNELEYLNKLNFKGAYVQLQKFLEIDKPKKYRDKMKGFLIR
jgi:Tfp pilus assembly protein PilF